MISKSREIFNDYIPDVWIYSDKTISKIQTDSQGYGISILAESNTGSRITAERVYDPAEMEEKLDPAELAEKCCLSLLEELYKFFEYLHTKI